MARRHNAKGRSQNPGAPYWQVNYGMAQHEAFRSLSGSAVKVLIELHTRYHVRGDGRTSNNGTISLSLDEGSRILGLGKATVGRALQELERRGFIAKTRQGHWYGRMATEWRLTDLPSNDSHATRDWQHQNAS